MESMENIDRIKKGTQSTQFGVQSVQKPFVLYKCYRSIDNSNDLYIFTLF